MRYRRLVHCAEDSASLNSDGVSVLMDSRRERYNNASGILQYEYTRRVGWIMQGRRQIVSAFAVSVDHLMTGWVDAT